MRRIAVLLMVTASALLAALEVAWAVTKTCPPAPKKCCAPNVVEEEFYEVGLHQPLVG
jgi:hypothetical protein